MNILLVDNNDSFTRNLEHLLVKATGEQPHIVAYDGMGHVDVRRFQWLVISPGPGSPEEYGAYGPVLDSGIPVLGVCLGMQIINNHFGGRTEPLPGCVHGRAEAIKFQRRKKIVARYHSLYCSQVPDCLDVIAENAQGVPMALAHKDRPLLGYQFHPESFLTKNRTFFIRYALDHLFTH